MLVHSTDKHVTITLTHEELREWGREFTRLQQYFEEGFAAISEHYRTPGVAPLLASLLKQTVIIYAAAYTAVVNTNTEKK